MDLLPLANDQLGSERAAIYDAMQKAYERSGCPNDAQLDITYRCDLDCQHCYLDNRQNWPELTTQEWLRVLDQLADIGIWNLGWSGGETLLRKDLLELLAYAQKRGFNSNLRTHAGSLTPAIAAELMRLCVTKVKVSIYSLNPEIHDRFTRRPGSLAVSLAGMRAARDAGLAVHADIVVQANTVEEIPALAAYFDAQGMSCDFGTNIYRDHLARQELDLLELTSTERIRARELIWQVKSEPVDFVPRPGEQPDKGPCGAGRTYLYISPDGAVWPCVMFPMELGHLRENSLREIWDHSPQRQAILAFTNRNRTACISCGGSEVCFYCPGEAFKHTGDFRNPPEHFHSRTRDLMHGYEAARGPRYTPDQWASVPAGGPRRATPGRFLFPIYRPSKHGGARVQPAKKP